MCITGKYQPAVLEDSCTLRDPFGNYFYIQKERLTKQKACNIHFIIKAGKQLKGSSLQLG